MSKHEAPMIKWLWEREGGTLVEEFEICKKGPTCARRLVDAVILPKRERWRVPIGKRGSVHLKGEDVIVVQAKAYRVGMYLMGQALFSAELVKGLGAASVRTVALCKYDDAVLGPLAEKYEIQVIVVPSEVWTTPKYQDCLC